MDKEDFVPLMYQQDTSGNMSVFTGGHHISKTCMSKIIKNILAPKIWVHMVARRSAPDPTLFDIPDLSPDLIFPIASHILFQQERVWPRALDTPRFAIVKLRHAMHFRGNNKVTILQFNLLIIHTSDQCRVVITDGCDDARVGLLSINIHNSERQSKITEHRSEDASSVSLDEGDGLVQCYVSEDNHLVG